MLNRIVNITSNSGFKEPNGSSSNSPKNLAKENVGSETSDKIELSPALKFLKKLEWNLKEVKVLEDKYYISFTFLNFEFNTSFSLSEINSISYLDYKIIQLSPSPFEDNARMYDYSKLRIELNLSIRFHKRNTGFLGITGRDSSMENFSDSNYTNSVNKLKSLFEKLFLIYIENVRRDSEILNALVEDSVDELMGLTRINDFVILFLEKLTGEKISPRILSVLNKNEEPLIIINAVTIDNLS